MIIHWQMVCWRAADDRRVFAQRACCQPLCCAYNLLQSFVHNVERRVSSSLGPQLDRAVPSWQRIAQRIVWAEPTWVIGLGILLLLPQRFLPTAIQAQTALWRASAVAFLIIGRLLRRLAISKLFRISALENFQQRLSAALPGNVNANQIAGVLAVVIPVAAALALRRDWSAKRWPVILAALATLFMLVMLALTQSRGAYMATAIALAVMALLRWPKLRYAIPVVVIAVTVVVGMIGPRNVAEMALSGSAVSGLAGRLEIWSRAFYAISDFPFTGIGIGTWNKVIPTLYPLFSVAPDAKLDHAHHLLLQVSLDLGLPGFIAYLALFANTIAMLIITLRRRAAAVNWTLAAGTLGALTAMFLHGIVDVPLWDSKPAFLPWLHIALAMLIGLQTAALPAAESSLH